MWGHPHRNIKPKEISLDVTTSGTLCPGFCISESEGRQQTKKREKKWEEDGCKDKFGRKAYKK